MIVDTLRTFASATLHPAMIAVCAALAMRYSMFWIHTTDVLALVPALSWIIATSFWIWCSIRLRMGAQTDHPNQEESRA